MKPLAVYDWKTNKRLAYLQNAYAIGYMQQTNAVWTATFTLPYSDEKKVYCEELNFVEIWDIDAGGDDKYVGLFRIMSSVESFTQDDKSVVYELEHVLGTLMDSVVFEYLTLGGEGRESTQDVINILLNRQTEVKWQLLNCAYTDHFIYEFEDMNLLTALFSVPQVLTEDYYWSYETRNFPWGIKLNKVSSIPISDIRYKKNILGITKKVDTRGLCTRLYPLGKIGAPGAIDTDGSPLEGYLNIASVNGGKTYIDSETGIDKYGIISQVVTNDSFETAQALYDYGVGLLKKIENPTVSYTVDTQLIYNAANLKIGDKVRIVTDNGVNQNLVIQQISKDDLTGAPNTGKIVIGNGTTEMGLIVKSFT